MLQRFRHVGDAPVAQLQKVLRCQITAFIGRRSDGGIPLKGRQAVTDKGDRQIDPAQHLQRGFHIFLRDGEGRRDDDRAVNIARFHALVVLKLHTEVVVRVADNDALAVLVEAIGDLLQELGIIGVQQVADDDRNGVRAPLFQVDAGSIR